MLPSKSMKIEVTILICQKKMFHLTKSDMKTHSAMGQQEHITGSPYTLVQSTFSLGKFWKKSIHIYTSLSLQHKTKSGGFQWSHGAMCTDVAEYGNLRQSKCLRGDRGNGWCDPF